MFRCLQAGDLDAVVCPELVADGGLSHYLLSVHEACSRPTAAVRFESEPAGAEVKTPSGQSCRTPCELTIQVAPELSVTFALAGYQSKDRIGALGGGVRFLLAETDTEPGSCGASHDPGCAREEEDQEAARGGVGRTAGNVRSVSGSRNHLVGNREYARRNGEAKHSARSSHNTPCDFDDLCVARVRFGRRPHELRNEPGDCPFARLALICGTTWCGNAHALIVCLLGTDRAAERDTLAKLDSLARRHP